MYLNTQFNTATSHTQRCTLTQVIVYTTVPICDSSTLMHLQTRCCILLDDTTTQKTDNHIYLMLEYCEAGDLQKHIKAHGRLSEAAAQVFMTHLAAGLKFLWDRNLIHRDLKPQNLLLTARGAPYVPPPVQYIGSGGANLNDRSTAAAAHQQQPQLLLKIADFGFARHLATATMAETLCGSPLYMAPEILQGRKYDAKADLWSVGTILFEMIIGRPPFGGTNQFELLRVSLMIHCIKFYIESYKVSSVADARQAACN
jgi:serine/threonine protein kinase